MQLICCNWKMNGNKELLAEFAKLTPNSKYKPVLLTPAPYLSRAISSLNPAWEVGAQACHAQNSGAYTGEVAAVMLAELGVSYVLVGHSERRLFESESFLKKSYLAAENAGLQPILCIGESLTERDNMHMVLESQLSLLKYSQLERLVIAYEPRWAIGSGLTPEPEELAEIFSWLRNKISSIYTRHPEQILLLYGGSLSTNNFAEFMAIPGVNGGLIGGASLEIKQVREMLAC